MSSPIHVMSSGFPVDKNGNPLIIYEDDYREMCCEPDVVIWAYARNEGGLLINIPNFDSLGARYIIADTNTSVVLPTETSTFLLFVYIRTNRCRNSKLKVICNTLFNMTSEDNWPAYPDHYSYRHGNDIVDPDNVVREFIEVKGSSTCSRVYTFEGKTCPIPVPAFYEILSFSNGWGYMTDGGEISGHLTLSVERVDD